MGSAKDSKVTIFCETHDKVLADGIRRLFKEEYLLDAKVTFNDVYFKVHRLILAIFLPTFKEHMTDAPPCIDAAANGLNTAQVLSVDYVASEADDVRALIDFIYSGKATVPTERIQHLSRLADDLHVDSLVKAIGKTMASATVGENAETGRLPEVSGSEGADTLPDGTDPQMVAGSASNSTVLNDSQMCLAPVVMGTSGHVGQTTCDLAGMSTASVGELQEKDGLKDDDCLRTRSRKLAVPVRRVAMTTRLSVGVTARDKSATSPEGAPSGSDKSKTNSAKHKANAGCGSSDEDSDGLEMGFTSESEEDERSADDSDWNPEMTGGLRKSKRQRALSKRRVTTNFAENSGKEYEEGLDRYCEQVLRTWEEDGGGGGGKRCNAKYGRASAAGGVPGASADESRVLTGPLLCDKCNEKFLSERSLKAHQKSCGQRQVYVCKLCGHHSADRDTFDEHFAEVHKTEVVRQPAKVLFQCTQCDFSCDVSHKLRTHIRRRHLDEKKHKCVHCEYSAFYKSEVERHVRFYHLKERNYVCEVCGERYQKGSYLKLHMRTKHQGIMPYKCSYCGKEFIGRRNFKIHVKAKHTGDAELHVCHICGRTATKRWNLQVHMQRVHGQTLESLKLVYAPRKPDAESVSTDGASSAQQEVLDQYVQP